MTLTSKERVLASFNHTEPDHVPCWLGASPEWKNLARVFLNLPDDEALLRYLGDDFRRVFSTYAGPPERSPDQMLSPGATWRSPFDIERHGYGYGMPLTNPLKGATLAEMHRYPWPNPDWMDVSLIEAEARQWGSEYAILGGEWSPFWHDAIDLLDFDGLIFQMYDNPEIVDAVMAYTADYYLEVSRRIFEAGDAIDIFFIGNDLGAQTGPLLSPPLFRQFILPHLARFVDLGHQYGKLVVLHCDGSIRLFMPDLIEIGMDGVQSIQPYAAGMELGGLKRDFGQDITFFGCVDTQALIEGTGEQARQLTIDTLDTMMPGGGFIASPSHDYLLPETPVENVIIMYETIKQYGSYS
ncbi:MAG: uroporphyrinogen decarboxylase family protein [Chloroflexota bacterium]|nr:uroporphyrinogen decarboxylase family protein [Chloroflexota bacterium]